VGKKSVMTRSQAYANRNVGGAGIPCGRRSSVVEQ